MRDRIDRLKLQPVTELEARQWDLLDELSAVRVALTERTEEELKAGAGPVGKRIGSALGRSFMLAFERQPLRVGAVILFLLFAIGSQLLEALGVR